VPGFLGQACLYLDEAQVSSVIEKAKADGRLIVQASQSTQMNSERIASYTPLVDLVIRYPHLQFYTLSPAEFAGTFGASPRADRMLSLDIGTIKVCQRRSGTNVDFAGFVESVVRDRPLFHTPLHPNGEMTARLFRTIADQLPGLDPVAVNAVEALIAQREGINFTTSHPVARDHLNALGFDWGPDYDWYEQMLKAGASGDWTRVLELYPSAPALYREDSQVTCYLARSYATQGDVGQAAAAYDRLVALSPGYIHYWLEAFEFHRSRNAWANLVTLRVKADAFYRGQRQYSNLMAFEYLRTQNYGPAETFGRDYRERTPDRADGVVPILKILVATGRTDEALELARLEAEGSTGVRLEHLRANLGNVPELGFTI
jgi:hypothetical protein